MDGYDQARLWKDPYARDEAGDDHPAGAMRTRSRVTVGLRAAVLAGVGLAAAMETVDSGIWTITTVSANWTM